jgi:hypothetical protein
MTRHPIRLTERGEWVRDLAAGVIAIVGLPATFILILMVAR